MVRLNPFHHVFLITVQKFKMLSSVWWHFCDFFLVLKSSKNFKQLWILKLCSCFGKHAFIVCKDKTNSDILKNSNKITNRSRYEYFSTNHLLCIKNMNLWKPMHLLHDESQKHTSPYSVLGSTTQERHRASGADTVEGY